MNAINHSVFFRIRGRGPIRRVTFQSCGPMTRDMVVTLARERYIDDGIHPEADIEIGAVQSEIVGTIKETK